MSNPNNLKAIKMQGEVRDETGELPSLSNHTQIAPIFVGEEKKEWKIPVDLLCFHSSYFRSALKVEFAGGKPNAVDLPAEKPEAFGLVVESLYTHQIKVADRIKGANISHERPSFGTLLDTWILADYLDLPRLQNLLLKIMDERATYHMEVPINEVSKAYMCTEEDLGLGRWIVDVLRWIIPQNHELLECFDETPDLELLKVIFLDTLQRHHVSAREKFELNDNHFIPE
ncbi:hypothetical protein V492_00212 [Pseudogymnoascus sp. VKM F-4246]|nr:hypothetical protein V492_00212 [Pseudogymnoascus sp. VKM F-4246]